MGDRHAAMATEIVWMRTVADTAREYQREYETPCPDLGLRILLRRRLWNDLSALEAHRAIPAPDGVVQRDISAGTVAEGVESHEPRHGA